MAKKQQLDDGATSKTLLQQSVIHYLHLNGFSKTLKRFLKETKTEGDSWKSCSLNLEDMYYKYLNCTDNDTNSKGNGQCEDGTNGNNTIKNATDSLETISKKKKKKRSEDKNNVSDASHPESVDKFTKNAGSAQEVLADDMVDVSLKKQKEKKKKKTDEKPVGVAPIGTDDNDTVGEPAKKVKKKKSTEENGATDTKDSKKRKRLASDENANQGVEGVGTEESNRKTEGLKESKDVVGMLRLQKMSSEVDSPPGDKLKKSKSGAKHLSSAQQKQVPSKRVTPVIVEENWVACAECQKWRLLPYGIEELPDDGWMCSMQKWLHNRMNHCGTNEEETTKAVRGLSQNDYMANAGKKKHKSRDTEPLMVQF